ncbi:MAG: S9 family peptidase [Thermoanaerobaculales bacterium]|jgi:dipeptidyl-peptidase-4|nr:S9 family peptidase [Thermoanaerobaculales bacterium]
MSVPSRSPFAAATVILALATGPGAGLAGQPDPVFEELFGEPATAREPAPEPVWRPGLGTVVWVEPAASGGPALVEFDPETGQRRRLLDGAVPGLPPLVDPVWRPDGGAVLLTGGDDPVLVDLSTGAISTLETGPGAEQHAAFAPDGRRIAWVRDNDLYVWDKATGGEVRLTDDGSATVFNGVLDWVYTEELADRRGRAFVWSDDGTAIAWLRLDDGEIPVHHLVDLMGAHSRLTEQRYPLPGDPAPRPALHVVRLDESSGVATRQSLSFSDPLPYIPRFGFTPRGELWFQRLDRAQELLELVVLGPDGEQRVLVSETDPHWLEPVDGLRFLDDGAVLWTSRRSGWTHLLRIDAAGEVVDLTPGPGDVTAVVGVDRSGRHAWYQAARPGPLERRLYRVELTTGSTVGLPAAGGTSSAELDPASGRLLVGSSSAAMPPRHRVVDGLGENAAEVPVEHPIARFALADQRFVTLKAEDGFALDGVLLLPPGFDETRRYPVVVFTYGGPHAQVVVDRWPGMSWLFNHALAGRGFVVFALDNRGSAARGRAFEGAVDGALGATQLADQLAGVAWLRRQPWVEPGRIGIWGWSYGGYMTAYALTRAPGVFAAGAAVAPVTDWRLYDSIYSERYMGTPDANPTGYAGASVLESAAALSDPLLVIHGTGDDNVHVQHTLQLADRAWRAGVRFDLMLLPDLDHGLSSPGARPQVFSAIADFFGKHLAPDGSADR